MHKLIALYHPPADPHQFARHLVEVHLPIVARFPGLLSMRHAIHVSAADGASPYAGVVECEFADEAAMQAALASPAGAEAAADVPNYAQAGVTILTFPSVDSLARRR